MTYIRHREVESHQFVEGLLLDLRPGFPAGYRRLSHPEETGKIALLQPERLAIAPDPLGCQQPDLTTEGIGDLIVRIIVENHGPAVRVAGNLEARHIDRIDPAIVVDLGRIRQSDSLDGLLPALTTRPGKWECFEGVLTIDSPPGNAR